MYVIHHRLGVIAFSFLLVHPLLLASRFVSSSFEQVANFLSPINNSTPITLGIISIFVMLLLLFITFYGSIFDYPKLKLAHKFLGFAFFLGFLHVFLIPSSLNSDPILKFSLVTTAGIGLIVFFYRTLLGFWLVPRYRYTISSVTQLSGGITEISLIPDSKKMLHIPGQFAILSITNSNTLSQEEHPFTLSSSGLDGNLRFSIKGLGDYTKLVEGLESGIKANIEGPFGEFSYIHGKEKQVWVAGGIGITPFVSMAENILLLDTLPYTIDLFYSVRTDNDGTYKELFIKLNEKHPSFTFHFLPSDTQGFITGDLLLNQIQDLSTRDIFVCGPPPLMSALLSSLLEKRIPRKNIHMERFALLK